MSSNQYALVVGGQFREIRHYPQRPPSLPHKNIAWYPVEYETGDAFEGVVNDTWVVRTPVAPPPVPNEISFAQLVSALVETNWITEADGNGWLAGTLPPQVIAVINSLPANQRFRAKAKALRPSVVLRNDPMVAMLAAAQNKTPEEVDQFFIAASQI